MPRPRRPMAEPVAAFRDADLDTAMTMVRAGFELETHATAGFTKDSRLGTNQVDTVRRDLDHRLYYRRYCKTPYLWYRYARNGARIPNIFTAVDEEYEFTDLMRQRRITSVTGLRRAGHITLKFEVGLRVFLKNLALQHCPDDMYRRNNDPNTHFQAAPYNLPPSIDCGFDGTVRGFEFRTIGGLTLAEFGAAATPLFTLNHVVDEGCSFHVHVSIPGVRHKYGPRMQKAMIEYLVQNQDKVPGSVLERWRGIHDNEYINGLLRNGNKYNFINKHARFNTWEFRCFGNVDNYEDAMRCLRLAVGAMQYGYKVVSGLELESDKASLTDGTWEDMVYSSLSNSRTLTATMIARRVIAA